MINLQNLQCTKGDTFAFEIDMQPNVDNTPPDLTGATASWRLAESWFDGARVFLTKTSGNGVFVNLDSGVWKIIVGLDPTDTSTLSPGVYYHECKVFLNGGGIAHVTSGEFILDPSIIP